MNQVRIIGGHLKRHHIKFIDTDGLRPTPDRLRETLFNWLMFDLQGKFFLDCCAGSGALGIEALSRGATQGIFIEANAKQAKQLQAELNQLILKLPLHPKVNVLATTAQLAVSDVQKLTRQTPDEHTASIELLFLDPPYALNLWSTLAQLYQPLLMINAFIYVEADKPLDTLNLPTQWQQTKQTKVGKIFAGLYINTSSD